MPPSWLPFTANVHVRRNATFFPGYVAKRLFRANLSDSYTLGTEDKVGKDIKRRQFYFNFFKNVKQNINHKTLQVAKLHLPKRIWRECA